MKRAIGALMVGCAVLAGCSAPADLDGEIAALGVPLGPEPTSSPGQDRTPVVVDTDLGADDLVALAFLFRHPDVDVRAITIAATGLVGCNPGLDVLGGLFSALDTSPPPVACGRAVAGPGAHPFPSAWRTAAAKGSGVVSQPGAVTKDSDSAVELVVRVAQEQPGVVLLALGPLTNAADVASQHPDAYRQLAAVHAMAGSVDGPLVDGVAEWNAAADPHALDTVLAAPTPLTLVPQEAVPPGTPDALHAPVVDRIFAAAPLPAWWDLATAAALLAPDAATVEAGKWALDPSAPGRLEPQGHGSVRVVRSLDRAVLEAEYARAPSRE